MGGASPSWMLHGPCCRVDPCQLDGFCVYWDSAARDLDAADAVVPASASGAARRAPDAAGPLARREVDFRAVGAVAPGWRLTHDVVPEGFLPFGCDARVVEEDDAAVEHGEARRRRVLLALPRWAVDLPRARWLKRAAGIEHDLRMFCRLWRVTTFDLFDLVVLEFDYPEGKPLRAWLDLNGRMSESLARVLCQDLLSAVTGLRETPLSLWGLLPAGAARVDQNGELLTLLPMGCLLSFRGAKAVALAAMEQEREEAQERERKQQKGHEQEQEEAPQKQQQRRGHQQRCPSGCVAPELGLAARTGEPGRELDESLVPSGQRVLPPAEWELAESPAARAAADSYAAAALVLEAITGEGPEALRKPEVAEGLPNAASDLLFKALYEEPSWRLSGEQALAHPWLRGKGAMPRCAMSGGG